MATAKRPNFAAASERSVRIWMQWTPAYIRSAEIAADSGNFYLAARLADWLIADDRIRSTLETRISALLGKPFDFESDDGGEEQIKALSSRSGMWWRRIPESKLVMFHMWGLMMGFAPGQNEWVERDGKLEPEIEFWHPQSVRHDAQKRLWLAAVEGSAYEQELTPGDGQWILHAPFGMTRPASYGYWRDLARWTLLKYYAISDWARHGEKGSILTGTVDRDEAYAEVDTQEYREALAQQIYDRGREAAIILPPGYDLKLVEARANTRDIYEAQINLANTSMAVLIRGGNLGTEIAQGGSRAAATSQYESGDLPRLRFDSMALQATTRQQILMPWASYNYGDPELAPWPSWDVEPSEDLKEKSEIEEKALGNFDTARKLGFKVNSEQFIEAHGITWAKGGSDVDKKPDEPEPVIAPDGDVGVEPPDPTEGGDVENRSAIIDERVTDRSITDAEEYVERLESTMARHGARELAPTVAGLLAEIDAAEGYADMERRIRERYGELAPPTKLAELIDAAMKMSSLAGILSVNEDL